MLSLAQLCDHLGSDLRPAGGGRVARRKLTGVHISELDDPTPYLAGGELLLTTGMPVSGDGDRVRRYVARLANHGVAALGLGLGAGTDSVPPELNAACEEKGVPLLIVPDGTPFMQVSRAYWDLIGKIEQADLAASLSMQTSLARAATQPEAAASVVKALAEALDGWAVYLPADGTAETIWPPTCKAVLPQLREETARLNLAGTYSSATFPLDGREVVEYSIVAERRTAGYLAVAAGRALRKADRQLMLTGCMLLSVTAQRGGELARANSILGGTAATLILHGYVDAARLAAVPLTIPPFAEPARLLAVRGEQIEHLTTEDLADVVASMVPEEAAEGLRRSIRRSGLRCFADGLCWVILDDSAVPSLGHQPSAVADGRTGATWTTERYAAAMSRPLLLNQVSGMVMEISRACHRAAAGQLVTSDGLLDPQAEVWVAALRSYARADLVETVRSYLRNRGQWEITARELNLHRNSLRHRIAIAATLINANLDDPDVAANLWLALRGVTREAPHQPGLARYSCP